MTSHTPQSIAAERRAGAGRDTFAAMDARDSHRRTRDQFEFPAGEIYLDGNSLGAMPRAVHGAMGEALTSGWGRRGIRVWNEMGWHLLPLTLGDRLARLMGAGPGEVLVVDSTSVNLFKLMVAALRLRPGRTRIVSETNNFPTDVHIIQGIVAHMFAGHRLDLAGDSDADVLARIDGQTAVVCLSHVNYRTGQLRDMDAVTKAAHAAGALVVWDLAHSLGALPVELNRCEVDFAVGCTYKYLNGGPGSPAYVFVAGRHLPAAANPLSGWQGHARPFGFEIDFVPADGIEKFRCGTIPLLSFLPLQVSLDIFEAVDMADLRARSLEMTSRFMELVDTKLSRHGLTVATPRSEARGSQVCLVHPHGWEIMQAAIACGVIGDFRSPDIMRFGFAPLYNTFEDVWGAASTLERIMETGLWRDPRFAERRLVT